MSAQEKPWEQAGMSRASWYRMQRLNESQSGETVSREIETPETVSRAEYLALRKAVDTLTARVGALEKRGIGILPTHSGPDITYDDEQPAKQTRSGGGNGAIGGKDGRPPSLLPRRV